MLVLRSAVFNVVFYTLLITMLIIGIPLLVAPKQTIKDYAHLWSGLSLRLLSTICGIEVVYRGVDRVPAGGFILASKHQSFLDILVLLPLAPHFTFVLKRELTWIPVFGQLLLRAGMIGIDRSKGRAVLATLNQRVEAALRAGQQLIIFPEGTRRPPGAEPAYRTGVAHLYTASGCTCLPVAMNAGLFWPRRSFRRYPGTLVVDIQPAIAPGLERGAFLTELQARIEAAGNRLLTEAGRAQWGRTA